jgi:anti-sigma factor (TIGR02949 family)
MSEPIDCRAAVEILQDYLKRELTPEVEAAVRAHLERCAPCFSYARFEENFLIMLEARAQESNCPGSLRARIVSALRAEMGGG